MAREDLTRGSARVRRLAVCIVLTALLGLPATAHAGFPGANGKIAFHSNRDGNYEVYAMNEDGSSQTDLTNNPALDQAPAWSPDGTKIAFVSNRDGNLEVYTMNADGSGQTDLTSNPADDQAPAWSPDGTKIAFASNRDGNLEVYSMNADGSGQTRLTNNSASDQAPAWSPDGTKIAFQTARDANWEVYAMNADGSGQTDLTNNSGNDEDPNWSPNGAQIAFESDRTNPNFDIYFMNADGSGQSRKTFTAITSAGSALPAWSPDGTKFTFTSDRDGNLEIYTQQVDLQNRFRRTTNLAVDSAPDWQPVPRNYARPKGATPMRVSLAPAFKQCTVPNSTHKPPATASSCVPPQPESSYLTVGTLNFNGQAANFVGSARFDVQAADGTIAVSLTDVRCAGVSGGCSAALEDYTGDLGFDSAFRLTDMGNGYGAVSGTAADLPLRFSVPCTSTAPTTVGSTCSINTTINTVFGGSAIVAGQREIWQLSGAMKLNDGGADGVASTSGDNTLFAVGGLFFP